MSLSGMTPTELANTPCSRPPEGVVENLNNPRSERAVLIAVGGCLVGVMLFVAAFRYYIKIFIRRKVTPDDWTALVAIMGTCAYYSLCVYAVSVQGYATHMWDVPLALCTSDAFAKTGFNLNWIPAVIWAFAKTTFFLMYLGLFGTLSWLRWACYVGLILNWAFYIGKLIPSIYLMVPKPGQSWAKASQNPRFAGITKMAIPIATGSLVLDVYILILPMIVLWNLRVTRSKRLGLAAIFGVGFLACIASTLSIVFNAKLEAHTEDITYWIYPTLLTAVLEMCTGIICSSMPTMTGFFRSDEGRRLLTWGTRLFSLGGRYGKGSVDESHGRDVNGLESRNIKTSTYIEVESDSTHELVHVHPPLAT